MNLKWLTLIAAILVLNACGNHTSNDDYSSSSSSEQISSSSSTQQSSNSNETYITDERDGKKYKSVEIGTQIWMAENLNYAGDGSVGRCYGDDNDNCNTYGRLYTLSEVACPSGWHLPSKEEWLELLNFVSNAGTKLKASNGWNGDGNGTDDYGFAALPGGYCGNSCPVEDSPFSDIGTRSFWWSASVGAPAPLSITFSISSGVSVGVFQSNATSRFYARCIRN